MRLPIFILISSIFCSSVYAAQSIDKMSKYQINVYFYKNNKEINKGYFIAMKNNEQNISLIEKINYVSSQTTITGSNVGKIQYDEYLEKNIEQDSINTDTEEINDEEEDVSLNIDEKANSNIELNTISQSSITVSQLDKGLLFNSVIKSIDVKNNNITLDYNMSIKDISITHIKSDLDLMFPSIKTLHFRDTKNIPLNTSIYLFKNVSDSDKNKYSVKIKIKPN